ncbi:hypothetical protein SAMN04515659_3884 [Dyella sp. 333MFSha]|nr:hypothetical protein SAMN04515659_3884 [Dyella sp. 333MFSha]
MIQMKKQLVLLTIATAMSIPALAADTDGEPLTAVPGRTVCQARPVAIGGKQVDAKLCVTEGSMSHDKYVVKIGWSTVVEGIDDETTKGIAGMYKGSPVSLTCEPQSKPPAADDPMVASMAKSMAARPDVTSEQAHDLAMKMLSTEVGRLCQFRQGDQDLMSVQVKFL